LRAFGKTFDNLDARDSSPRIDVRGRIPGYVVAGILPFLLGFSLGHIPRSF
jgi:hypothetical protein